MVEERIKNVEELLRKRESRGLQVPIIVRILYTTYGVTSAFTYPLPSESRLIILFSSTLFIVANVYFLFLLKDTKNVARVGITGVALDVSLFFFFRLYCTMHLVNHHYRQPFLPELYYCLSALFLS